RARLQRHIERRAACRLACTAQRLDLGMGTAAGLGPATADNHAIPDDDCTDGWIRRGRAQTAPAERQCQVHEARICGFGLCEALPELIFEETKRHRLFA